ncbi:MAG: glycosyl hydrolase, partial [Thermoanaerobaculia bacterium]
MRTIALSLAVVALTLLAAPVVMAAHHTPTLTPQDSGTLNRLQAVSAVNPRVVWVSGLGGTYAVTTDGGKTWRAGVVPGAETLQFRDVEGVNARVAYLMAAGPGTDSRIYKTEDGGTTWSPQFMNEEPDAFYDCFAFWNQKRGITFSDAVDGRFPVIRTTDG